MKRSTATRRLVKSPPELWAELSSEDSLARHLAEFGEIRITRVKPETTVAWEGDRASGTVELAPTGWGTKVILTATPAEAPPERVAKAQAPPEPVVEVYAPAGPARIEPRPELARRQSRLAPPEPARIELRPQPARPEPAPPEKPRGFFARLFRKRAPAAPSAPAPATAPAPPAPDPAASIPAPPAPDPAASIPGPPAPTPDPSPPAPAPQPGPLPPPAPDPVPPTPAPEPPPPPQIRALDPERTVAILTEVLDDLGSAHHRPFSRDQD